MDNIHRTDVYVVNDHELVRRGVDALLQTTTDLHLIGEAGTYAQALRDITDLSPDVVILDVELPDGSGIDLCRAVRAADPAVKILVLTGSDDADGISAAIMAGATGYVLKRIDGSSLLSGIRVVAAGHSLIDPSVAARVIEQMDQQRRSLDIISDLTPQQRRIFFLIAEGLTNRQIGERLFLAEKTIKNHVTGLLARLGLEHRTQAALLASRMRDTDAAPKASGRGTQPTRVPAPRSGPTTYAAV